MHRIEKVLNTVIETNWQFAEISVVATAIELDIFAIIKKEHKTIEEIAKSTKSSPRVIESILNTLVGMRLLSKSNGKYKLTLYSKKYLIKDNRVRNIIVNVMLWRVLWICLKDVVKKGRPLQIKEFQKIHTPRLLKMLFAKHYKDSKHIAKILEIGKGWRRLKILDIGAGTAPWSIATAEKDKLSRVTAVDFPYILNLTKEYVRNYGLDKQFLYLAGNFRNLSFSASQYDLAILGHVCHSEGDKFSQKLINKVYRTLHNGGKILIADHIPNNSRTGPLWPIIFDLWQKIVTKDGGTFTMKEYSNWLKKAGFLEIKTIKLPSGDSPVIVATKICS